MEKRRGSKVKPGEAKRIEINLITQQEVFERSYSSLLTNLKHTDKKIIHDLKVTQSQTDIDRKEEIQNLQKSLLAIAMVIQRLKHNIRDEQYLEEHDTEHFKNHFTSVEEKLVSFKSLLIEQLEILLKEESALQESVNSLMRRVHENAGQSSAHIECSVRLQALPRVDTRAFDHLHPDIQEFQQFVQNRGGHTGGWDTSDHVLFTRLLQKFRGSNRMTTALLDLMPDKTAEEIAEHESWYHEYLTLKEANRKAIQEWRDELKAGKQNPGEDSSCEIENLIANSMRHVKRDPKLKEKIDNWKKIQEEKRCKELQEMQQSKKQEEEKWQKKVAYFEQQRKLLAAKREQQEAAHRAKIQSDVGSDMSLKEEHEKHIRIPLKEFWEQDRQFIQRRRSRLQRSSPSTTLRSSSHSRVQGGRNPGRLLQPTANWKARIKRSLSEENRKFQSDQRRPLFIGDVPHLAKPKWREGLV